MESNPGRATLFPPDVINGWTELKIHLRVSVALLWFTEKPKVFVIKVSACHYFSCVSFCQKHPGGCNECLTYGAEALNPNPIQKQLKRSIYCWINCDIFSRESSKFSCVLALHVCVLSPLWIIISFCASLEIISCIRLCQQRHFQLADSIWCEGDRITSLITSTWHFRVIKIIFLRRSAKIKMSKRKQSRSPSDWDPSTDRALVLWEQGTHLYSVSWAALQSVWQRFFFFFPICLQLYSSKAQTVVWWWHPDSCL